jgi:hypothetical protein
MSGKAFLNALTALAALGFVVLAVAATAPATGPVRLVDDFFGSPAPGLGAA